MLFPSSIANSLIAVGTDGLQERDRMVRAAIAIICELGEYLALWDGEPLIVHTQWLREEASGSCDISGQKHLICYEEIWNASNISLLLNYCLCSPEEPRGGGQTGRPLHHPEECDWLSAEPHQRSSDHHRPPSTQPPTYPSVRACWRRTGGTHEHTEWKRRIQGKLPFINEPVCWESFQSGLVAVSCPSFSHGDYSNQLQRFSKASLSVNRHLGQKHLITAVLIFTWMSYET